MIKNKKENEKQIIDIDNITYGGDGIGHLSSGKAIFVPKTIPGEKHLVEVKKEKKSYAYGQSIKLLNKADNRIEPKCEIFDRCGGCQWQHIDYEGQKSLKEDILKDSLQRIGKIDNINIEPVIGVDHPWFYRNKSTIPFELKDEKIIAGFYKKGTHQVVDNHTCYIQHQLINRIKREVIRLLNSYDNITVYNEKTNQGLLRHLHIRVGVCTNQALLTFITTDDKFPYLEEISDKLLNEIKELKGVLRNINNKKTNVLLGKKTILINGQDHIYDYIGERKYKISPDTFFQINTMQTKKLYDVVNDLC
ncbi:MAG: 23S rRNA (uracil(1939)-C(5))-methyltransferase RlmD [Halanaerobiales bacterium]|nr:23S rRNA (uracil(1939)-C(5))-methyltransferase RlmD [Halanaerobiales bacterium]